MFHCFSIALSLTWKDSGALVALLFFLFFSGRLRLGPLISFTLCDGSQISFALCDGSQILFTLCDGSQISFALCDGSQISFSLCDGSQTSIVFFN